ncbi:hypothetical protein [Saccharothrix australiensis]|uniref:hypothetical protein n=1 Tax=Saccharothrix australiensis TaxID=2072 RepID=UPI0011C43AE8|nr:hypothetical protein [Saccharothrix australiensis]
MRRMSLPVLVVLLAGCGADGRFIAIDDVLVPAPPVAAGGHASTGAFHVDCGRNEGRHLRPADRLAVVDGTLSISSPAGGPTLLRVEIPCPQTAGSG